MISEEPADETVRGSNLFLPLPVLFYTWPFIVF